MGIMEMTDTERKGAPKSRPKTWRLWLAGALFAMASAAIPLSLIKPWIGLGLWAAMTVGCAVLVGGVRVGAVLTLLASAIAFAFSGTYLFVGTLVTALIVGVFSGAFLFGGSDRPFVACLPPLFGVGVMLIFTRDWFFLLTALSLLPAAALTYWATKRNLSRTAVICYGAGGLLAAVLLLFCLAIARTESGLSLETVRALLDSWKEQMLSERIAMRDDLLEMLEQAYQSAGAGNAAQAQEMLKSYRNLLSDANLSAELTDLFNVLPGALVAASFVAVYLGQLLLLEGFQAADMRDRITPETEFLVMSLPAAVIWSVSLILSLILDGSTEIPAVTADNLLLILTPGFCAVGFYALRRFLRMLPAPLRRLLILPALAIVCCASSSIFLVLAAYGAYATFVSAIRRAASGRGESR